MDVETFNTVPDTDAGNTVRACADIPEWIAAIVAARPYATAAELLRYAQAESQRWRIEDVDGALSQHPRIGERAAGTTAEAEFSRNEQPAVDDEVGAELQVANRDYEGRFGRIFLIRAAGRTPAEILASIRHRLTLSPDEEQVIVIDQLRQIALRRLAGAVQ